LQAVLDGIPDRTTELNRMEKEIEEKMSGRLTSSFFLSLGERQL
tara:strand:+ start:17907 stop:18038 length:132 start_codon:yes stop_codon:yes gene_type:complete